MSTVALMQARPPFVRFEMGSIEDRDASIAAGRYMAQDCAFAYITPSGSKDVHVARAEEWLRDLNAKANKPEPEYNPQWAQHFNTLYERWKNGAELPAFGTPIRTWPLLSPAQVKKLIDINVTTVEDLAAANEPTLVRIGMGAQELKAKAVKFLEVADSGKTAAQLAAQDIVIEGQARQLDEQNKLIAALNARLDALEATPRQRAPKRQDTDDDPVK
jgi:hypothetical protein